MKWRVVLCVCACLVAGVAARPVLDASHDWAGGTDDAYTTTSVDTSVDTTAVTSTTVDSSGATEPEGSTAPPTSAPAIASTTLLGSPFTTPSTSALTTPSETLPTTQPTPTVAPCPPCPQFDYAVLAATTVTNTGPTSVSGGVGLWPGTAVTGFPPGIAVVDAASPATLDAQTALTASYLSAAARIPTVIDAQLGGQTLTTGVYTALTPFDLTGTLILDGPGRYVFQTASTLITASGSRVELVNGARACDVVWQVGSSATLGTGSEFAGTIMALASITVTTGVTVHGRALARTGAVTLDSDTFTLSGC